MAEILKDTHDEEWLRAKVLSPEYGDGFSLTYYIYQLW
jgi:hypothetical protein